MMSIELLLMAFADVLSYASNYLILSYLLSILSCYLGEIVLAQSSKGCFVLLLLEIIEKIIIFENNEFYEPPGHQASLYSH